MQKTVPEPGLVSAQSALELTNETSGSRTSVTVKLALFDGPAFLTLIV